MCSANEHAGIFTAVLTSFLLARCCPWVPTRQISGAPAWNGASIGAGAWLDDVSMLISVDPNEAAIKVRAAVALTITIT